MQIHPYTQQQPSDMYFVGLANRLYESLKESELPDTYQRKLALYAAAYLEDLISGLGLWESFTQEHRRLYGRTLPFYPTEADYCEGEPNQSDLKFLVWNTWQKALFPHPYLSPEDPEIDRLAGLLAAPLAQAYEEAPENECLNGYFDAPGSEKEGLQKLTWLFGHTYLTEPSMAPYIERVTPSDRFIIPTGPLALFLHEWVDLLSENTDWKKIKGLYLAENPVPAQTKEKNREMYRLFTAQTQGHPVVYLNGYDELRRFLVDVLKWQDDDNHTLPHLKPFRNFILMTNEEKGILLTKDICEYISDPANPLYDKDKAQANAFRLLTEETLCPPDLLTLCIRQKWLPEAVIPGTQTAGLVTENADFIARHSLLYYYRGD